MNGKLEIYYLSRTRCIAHEIQLALEYTEC